jgi:carbon-monoxide dehydrogenase medium subunit
LKPPRFEYHAPRTATEAVSLLKQCGTESKVLAGGQSLVPLLNMRLARPSALVDINRVRELDYIREENGALAIGALTRQRTIEQSAVVRERQPLLYAAVRHIGHPQIRNRGTVGGSLAHADPAAELPAAAVALGGEIRALGPNGERSIAAGDFFLTFLTSALDQEELLVELRVPAVAPATGWAFTEVARRHGDFALAGAAVVVTLDSSGRFLSAAISLFGVAPTPIRAAAAEASLVGEAPSLAVQEHAASIAAAGIDHPVSDIHGSSEFRRHLASVLTRRALAEAAERAGHRD